MLEKTAMTLVLLMVVQQTPIEIPLSIIWDYRPGGGGSRDRRMEEEWKRMSWLELDGFLPASCRVGQNVLR
jgi:hypothetical protein